jgi:hypothetical protein
MADRKISELNTLTGLNVADDDKLVIVDTSADETKAITAAQLRVAIGNSAFNFTDDVIIAGDLTVNGTTTTINTVELLVEDKNVTIAYGAVDPASADGAGLTVDGANATITYINSTDSWDFNKDVTVPNLTTSGNVDGRDVSVDGAKLDGIEAGADVTDATNVAAAGAAMTANNLSDLASATTARGNLGLATVATTGAYADLSGTPAAALPLAGGTLTGDVNLGDNVKAVFGAGSDLQIYHDGTDSYIAEGGSGTGSLKIKANNLLAYNNSDVPYFQGITGGTFRIYHNGSTKLATTATGIDVTGTVVADGLTVDGTGAIKVPVGTEAQRPTPATGQLRFNSDATSFEGYDGSAWGSIGGGATSDAIYENSATIAEDITIATGRNGMSTGPISVAGGVTVTVESGARYVVI